MRRREILAASAGAKAMTKARLVEVRSRGSVDARGRRDGAVLRRMLDAGVKERPGEASRAGGWKRLFGKVEVEA